MPDIEVKALTSPSDHPLLDRPSEERLLAEIESLRRQLEQERNHKKDGDQKPPYKPNRRTLIWVGVALLGLMILAFVIGFVPHFRRERQLQRDAQKESQALATVNFILAPRSASNTDVSLPGNMEAITESPILARADGFLVRRYADIGDRVRIGQLLAEIEAPDLDQQVQQARAQLSQTLAAVNQAVANLNQGKANQALAHVTALRWAALLQKGAVSRQENDQYQAADQAQTANVNSLDEAVSVAQQNASAAQANLDRLIDLQSYKQVRAPFTGVITLRNVDVGALISANTTLLFREAQTDRLRTYIYAPEANAPTVQVGQPASLHFAEYPRREVAGTITRTFNSLDPATRTLLTEVQVPNTDGSLLPGMFAQVKLRNARTDPPILIPGDALLVRSNGTKVAVLSETGKTSSQGRGDHDDSSGKEQGKKKAKNKAKNNAKDSKGAKDDAKSGSGTAPNPDEPLPVFVVHLVPVEIGRDYGNEIEILSGLNGGERVVVNPNDDVQEGAQVRGAVTNQNPDQSAQPAGGANANANGEKLSSQPGGESVPKEPSKERKDRGPGY